MDANLDLIDGGYNFVMLDADVYLTGTRHPLSGMRPLDDLSWEIQFQNDNASHQVTQETTVNIGWYWARPTRRIREFFNRSLEVWEKSHRWDQEVMNEIRFEMIGEGSLAYPKSIVLSYDDYETAMLVNWPDFYFDQSRIADWNNNHIIIHYTMIFSVLKTIIPKHFGQWFVEDYYTQPRQLIQAVNIAGSTNQALEQIALSVYLAKISGRTYMWPLAINHTCSLENPDWRPRAPTAVAEARLVAEHVPWVEDNYLFNRKWYTSDELQITTIPFVDGSEELEESWHALTETCRSFEESVLQVDFSGVDIDRLRELPSIRESIENMGLVSCGSAVLPGDRQPNGCVYC